MTSFELKKNHMKIYADMTLVNSEKKPLPIYKLQTVVLGRIITNVTFKPNFKKLDTQVHTFTLISAALVNEYLTYVARCLSFNHQNYSSLLKLAVLEFNFLHRY